MKCSLREISLCERDALRDMEEEERRLIRLYAEALAAGEHRSFRAALLVHVPACANAASEINALLREAEGHAAAAERSDPERMLRKYEKIEKQLSDAGETG